MAFDDKALTERLERLGVREADLEERFIRASGPGGQKVNKTSSAVQLKHVPTGVEVRVESERSQAANRQRARELLAEKLEARAEAERRALIQQREKKRRQRRGRPRGVKERILKSKKHRGDKKRLRGRVKNWSRD
ncbi:MAG: peptide chain release factor-like protein [Myxococcales bacterium]|nr:peptide chain release factor-like protein [Myxococcales bacterium]